MTTAPERSVPRVNFTDAEAGAKEFPDSDSRNFNYYTPAKRKQSHYEDMTVEVQPDPRHYLAQGWLYGFADGVGGYPLEWTALKAWVSDRPIPERGPGSGGKGYPWPALGWHEFRDPNEEWELTLYRYNANVVRQLNQNIEAARQAKAFDQWNDNWVDFVARHVGAWMHVDHGLGLYLFANANRRAPTNMHNNAISVNSMHRIRSSQDLALGPGLAGRPRGLRGSHRDLGLVRGDLRRERRVRAAGGRTVPQRPRAAGVGAQWRLRHADRGRRRGVRLRRARPALHDGDVHPAGQRQGVRRPQQGDPAVLADELGTQVHRGVAHAAAAVVAVRRQAVALRGRARPRQEALRRHPVRAEPGDTEGAEPVTTFKTAESPFKANNTASNMCGFTLMNNQVGAIVAEVMAHKDNVKITPLPSMIRVDAKNRMDVVYSEIDEAAGEEDGWFNSAEFEENMSTHYGRMIHEDDRTIMFANPEDAAEFLDFDLVARA